MGWGGVREVWERWSGVGRGEGGVVEVEWGGEGWERWSGVGRGEGGVGEVEWGGNRVGEG